MTNSNNDSDYTKPHLNLYSHLPETMQTDTNRAIFSNLFDRYLTKQEVLKVTGYIGEGNRNAIQPRQIHESTVHRQAFQLQPILHTKIGSVEHMASWKDTQNELTRLGVDMETYDQWGSTTQFNWAPPVDIDKLIHYQDYYWYDEEAPNSDPEYITIRSRCSTATAMANFWQLLTEEYGVSIPITNLVPVDDMSTYPEFAVVSISASSNTITVTGDVTPHILAGQFFTLVGNVNNNGVIQASGQPYGGIGGQTVIPVAPGTFSVDDGVGGILQQRKFDKLVVSGEYVRLFDPGFVFFLRESSNVELNDTFWTVVESAYDIDNNETIIVIDTTTTDDTADGVMSLEEQLNIHRAERDCQCTGSVGWDMLQWDDNIADPLWDNASGTSVETGPTADPDSHTTLLNWISHTVPPSAAPVGVPLWYNTVTDIAYQYEDTATFTGWKILWNRFSNLLSKTQGLALWDLTPGCGIKSVIQAAEQWVETNKWLHKTDVPSFSVAKQAAFPIIEYDWDLELNDWTYSDSSWKYRKDKFSEFVLTDDQPSLIEIHPLNLWELQLVGSDEVVVFDERYGDLTKTFTPGSKIQAENTTIIFNVVSSTYQVQNPGEPLHTRIVVEEVVGTSGLLSGDLSASRPSTTPFVPYRTINDDVWKDYGVHWLYVGKKDTVPVNHQPVNPETQLIPSAPTQADPLGFDYRLSYAVEEFVVTSIATLDTFEFHSDVLTGTQRPLNRRSLAGTDDIRVYTNDIREYGTYDELIDNTVKIIGVVPIAAVNSSQWVLEEDISSDVFVGDTIRISNNTGIGGSGEYTVFAVAANVVTVEEVIPATAQPDGTLSNISSPIINVGSVSYVRGIKFNPGSVPQRFDTIRIEVGPATVNGIGNAVVPVRTVVDNAEYLIVGDEIVSAIEYKLVEQVKSKINQYPLFDIYNADGTTAHRANAVFGYKTSPDAPVNPSLGLRMVADYDQRVFSFDQFLIDEDGGAVFAYRDYSNIQYDFWFNTSTNKLFFWTGLQWTTKTFMSEYYREAVVGDLEPSAFERSIDGLYWFDTLSMQLFIRDVGANDWVLVSNVDIRTTDNTIQSIWKKGLNNEQYIPAKVDWIDRTAEEYQAERDLFVQERTEELINTVHSISLIEAETQANTEWLKDQSNHLSPTGEWIGDWEIPHPLYYNHMHENRKCITSRELLTHVTTMIDAQPKIPGYLGPKEGMFHLIPTSEVNYGLGGTIHEYGDSFDQFLSSVFVNNVTPRSLIEFGHDQYESLLNNIKEIYRGDAISFMTNVSDEAILDFTAFVSEQVINSHETLDFLSTVYGDSTVFNDDTDQGIRNWIVTMPYMALIYKQLPGRLIDGEHDINQVVHHDGHRANYFLTQATRENIIRTTLNAADDRTRFPTPADDPLDTFGRASNVSPPNNIVEFDLNFNTNILKREGVYWYHTSTDSVLYRLTVAESGPSQPSVTVPDGTLWMDMASGFEVLRIKTTDPITGQVDWDPVPGLNVGDGRLHNGTDPSDVTTATISAWVEVDLDVVLGDVIYDIEQKIYDNVPDITTLRYELDRLRDLDPVRYDEYLREAFNDHVSQSETATPLVNIDYTSADPFTWNYKFSTSGVGISLLDAEAASNTFAVVGNLVSLFDPCSVLGGAFCPSTVQFYIKNSDGNDGTWTTTVSNISTPSAVYDNLNNVTIISVQEPVVDGVAGIMYTGQLASSNNTGSESGGDWRDYYQKVYGTPFPHLEPWLLQGYKDRPEWWDEYYLNDAPSDWGDRRWKYKHGFEIVGIDIVDDGFYVDGDFRHVFKYGQQFTLDQTPSAIYDSTFTVTSLSTIANVNTGVAGTASITIPTDFTTILPVGERFATSNVIGEPTGLFTVKQIVYTGPPGFNSIILVEEEISDATGLDIITGITYDPQTNQTKLRVVEDLTVNLFGGRVLEHHGMWEQIRVGLIPPGETYSNGVVGVTGNSNIDRTVHNISAPEVPTYNFFSVNIDNVDVVGGTFTYAPDDVYPPYFDPTLHYTTAIPVFDVNNRSLFSNFNTEIVSPSTNFAFGDSGPVEWEWRTSSQFWYDQMTIAYRLDPVRFVDKSFGINTYDVGGLEIDETTLTPISHNRITFHGEIANSDLFLLNGTGQWYTNYNRFNGYDANYSDFRAMWTGWTAPLTYQFASFVDTPSMDIDHRYVDISEFDFNISSKRAPGVEDHWYDVFDVHVTKIPPSLQRYDNQLDWGLELHTNLNQSRDVKYYDVHNYQFYANPTTGVMTIYTWEITAVDPFNKTFTINGNQVDYFKQGSTFIIADSTGNDNTYQVFTSAHNLLDNTTVIELDVVIPSTVADGTITLLYRNLPWQTGDIVYLSTAETLPSPYIDRATGGLIPYYIIVDDIINFRLAGTREAALLGNSYPVGNTGKRDHFVGELRSTFVSNGAIKTDTLWRHYAIDKSNILTMSTPYNIQGMQTLVNIIDGYDVLTHDTGWRINEDNKAADPNTGRPVGWQVELERFIDYAFGLRALSLQNVNKYKVSVDVGSNVWTFIEPELTWETGDAINVFTSNGVYPDPITRDISYYIIRDTDNTFRLATSKREAENGNEVNITSIAGVDELQIGTVRIKDYARHQEINPTRGSIWFRPERGIVSNIVDGPAPDIRTTTLTFDQDGHPIKESNLRVFREDKSTKIMVIEDLNPAVIARDTNPYTWLHFGGMHLFVDAYEHVLRLNNYTSENVLLYDPFIGLNVTKFEMLFNRQVEFSERPNVGGYYMHTNFNQSMELKRNIEASVEDIRYMYDTNNVLETTEITTKSRKSLGYDGTREYLDNLNLHAKSQFLFWKGAIQAKGSAQSMEAFVNSRRFIDAKLDEYWAYRIADFGSTYEKEYPEIYITTDDAKSNDIRLQFVDDTDFCTPGYAVNNYDKEQCGYAFPNDGDPVLLTDPSFSTVRITDDDRWFNQPDQAKVLRDNGLNMYFELNASDTDQVHFSELSGITILAIDETALNDTTYATITLNEVVDVAAGSFVAIRESIEDINNEYVVVASTDNGTESTLVIDKDPFDPIVTSFGVLYIGPASSPNQNWILPADIKSNFEYITWNDRTSVWDFDGQWSGNVYDDDNPTLRHNFKSDAVLVTLRLYSEGYNEECNFINPQPIPSDPDYNNNVLTKAEAAVATAIANDVAADQAILDAAAYEVVALADQVTATTNKDNADLAVEDVTTELTAAQLVVASTTAEAEVAAVVITTAEAVAATAEIELTTAIEAVDSANTAAGQALVADTELALLLATNTLIITSYRNIGTITTIDDVGGNLGGTYFTFDTGTDLYYVWYDTGSSVDPAIAGRIAIPVVITSGDVANTIATLTHAAIDLALTLNVTVVNNVVEIEHVVNSVDVDTLFDITQIQTNDYLAEAYNIGSITTINDIGGNLGGTHFTFGVGTDLYYVWYDTGSSVDPAIAGRIAIPVVITINDTATAIALATFGAIDTLTTVTVSVALNVVEIKSADNTVDVDTLFSITQIQGVADISEDIGLAEVVVTDATTANVEAIAADAAAVSTVVDHQAASDALVDANAAVIQAEQDKVDADQAVEDAVDDEEAKQAVLDQAVLDQEAAAYSLYIADNNVTAATANIVKANDDKVVTTENITIAQDNEQIVINQLATNSNKIVVISKYIPNTNGIQVFKRQSQAGDNFVQLRSGVEYVESVKPDATKLPESELLTWSDTLLFREPLLDTDVIKVVHVTSELVDTVHYNVITSNIVHIDDQIIFDKSVFPQLNNVAIWGMSVNEDAQNPARLLDKISHTSITPVQLWDPARNHHYSNAIHNIDLQNDFDPALYTNTVQTQERIPDQVFGVDSWTDSFVGTTWLDTTNLDYVPYYDNNAMPDLEARLREWGQLADWGSVDAYEWVKSDVPPIDYDSVAATEEGDVSIAESERKSGTAKLTLFEDDNGDWKEVKAIIQEFDTIIDGVDIGDGVYEFTTTAFALNDIVDVYVNGRVVLPNYELFDLVIPIETTIFDRVRVMKPIETDRDVIDAGVEAGVLLEDYQYVTVTKRDRFDAEYNEYFFWVANKGTKPDNLARTDTLSGAAHTLETMPLPYMFFQNLKTKTGVEVEGDKLLPRLEQYVMSAGQTSVLIELPVATGTIVSIEVDSIPMSPNDFTYTANSRFVTFVGQPDGALMEVRYTGLYDETVDLPPRFSQMVLRGLRGIIDADQRYTLRYTRDFTLRDTLDSGKTPLQLKPLHSEWEMFREQQPYHIDRGLWDNITEAIIGYKLSDPTIRIPSFERELYDSKFGASTRYGLGNDQAFVDGALALSSVIADLENPDNDFQPIDINVFFERHNFNTPEAIISAMDTIYNTYSFEHVNRIFFSVLHDALSTQNEYADIIKTSMVSLHGIRPFQVGGVFDD